MLITGFTFVNKKSYVTGRGLQYFSKISVLQLGICAKTGDQKRLNSLDDVIASSERLANLLGHHRPFIAIYGRQVLVRVITLEM